MCYPPRLCFDGAVYHVTARGDNRERIFADDVDRQQYLVLLRRYKASLRFTLHAYALMPNHLHLIVEPAPGTTISRIMQCVTISHTRYFNRRHGRVGHVFQGRFHSRLIEKESYLLVASRYVHLNPERAKLAARPGDYVWSSYRAYQEPAPDPLGLADVHGVLGLVSPDAAYQRQGYREFVEGQHRVHPGSADEWLSRRMGGTPP